MNNLIEKYKLNFQNIDAVAWKTEDSNQRSILFYKINDMDPSAMLNFEKRIENSKYKYCLVNSSEVKIPDVICVSDVDWKELQKQCCDEIYPINLKSKKIIGITGTNGKTTTTDIIRQILVNERINVLTIGTLGVWKNDKNISDFGLTSPSYIDLRKILFQNKEVDNIVCEMSSHALDQDRYYSINLDAAIWTSFSQDHLDYHKSMEDYFNSKSKILLKLKESSELLVSNLDKDILKKLNSSLAKEVESNIKISNEYFKIPYNLKNLCLAVRAINNLGISIKTSLENLSPTPGRYNIYNNKEDGKVIVDFAHTPDAIENISKQLKETYNDKKLIIIYGCGGDRDKSKRPLMGKAAAMYADYIYVTSDNPRFENPLSIINDSVAGIDKEIYEVIEDRAIAIKTAIENFPREIILIAGKGHEEYIDQDGSKRYFSDKEEVLKGTRNDSC
jgi:UDP-N-acetylmuramoyl-L-alanyl-D-glutamate--2,6-diaminopimelate ligase